MCVSVVTLLLKELKASLKIRLNEYQDHGRRVAQRACLYFSNFVRRRGYDGALHIDMEKKELEMIVSLLNNSEDVRDSFVQGPRVNVKSM